MCASYEVLGIDIGHNIWHGYKLYNITWLVSWKCFEYKTITPSSTHEIQKISLISC